MDYPAARAAICAVFLCATTSAADATRIYWTDRSDSTITRAATDGTGLQVLIGSRLDSPRGIDIDLDAGRMYWAEAGPVNCIRRANLDGTGIEEVVVGLVTPMSVAIDDVARKIYWTDFDGQKIQRANLDGSNVEDLITTGLVQPFWIDLDPHAGKMYWTDPGANRIQRADLDGSNIETLRSGEPQPYGIALDLAAGHLYWTDPALDMVQRAGLDGSNVEPLVTGLTFPVGITLDLLDGRMYWVDAGADQVQRARLDGTGVQSIVTSGLNNPYGIALDLPDLLINEIDADTLGFDMNEFIELYDGGSGGLPLDGLVLVLFNGADDESYLSIDLDGFTTDAAGFFVIGSTGMTEADLTMDPGTSGWIQNGADAVALYRGDDVDFPGGTPLTPANLVDAFVYDTNDADDPELLALLHAGEPQVNEDGGGDKDAHSSQRCPDGAGGPRRTSAYAQALPTPGLPNDCPSTSAGSLVLENASGSACFRHGETVTISVSMHDLIDFEAAGFQAFLAFDPARLTFESGAYTGVPFGLPVITPISATPEGFIDLAAGIDQLSGQGPTSADALLATLTFTANDTVECDGAPVLFRLHDPPSRLSDLDGTGPTMILLDTDPIVIDAPPVIEAPADIIINADAGGCSASLDLAAIGTPSVSDGCTDPLSIAVSFVRSDGEPQLTDPYDAADSPVTITWRATDECGNTATDEQVIDVAARNEVVLDLQLAPTVASPVQRCVTFEFHDCGGGSVSVDALLVFTDGRADAVNLLVPCGDYACVTARDRLHTLRRTDLDDFRILGTRYVGDFTDLSGAEGDDDSLIGGNLNDDAFIDILDFGIFTGQWSQSLAQPDCITTPPHADLSGEGNVFTEDFSFIHVNFLRGQDAGCCAAADSAPPHDLRSKRGPVTEISVGALWQLGMGHLAVADLNDDGWLNQLDIAAFLAGARPQKLAVYQGPEGGSWFEAANWAGGFIPDTDTDVVLTGSQAVIADAGAVARHVTLRDGAILALINGSLDAASLRVDPGAALQISGQDARLSVESLAIAAGASLLFEGGLVEIVGGALQLAQQDLFIGSAADAVTLRLLDGAQAGVEGDLVMAPAPGTQGRIEIIESRLDVGGALTVGVEGEATLLLAAASVHAAGAVEIGACGEVRGNGDVAGYVMSDGRVAPEDELLIRGDFVQRSSGSVMVAVRGSEADAMTVEGAAHLDGSLTIMLDAGDLPPPGASFDVLYAGSLRGAFPAIVLEGVAEPPVVEVLFLQDRVTVTFPN